MFTKEIIKALFTKRNGQNFILKTNEGNGRGINGVDFSSYYGYREWEDRSYSSKTMRHVKSEITELEDTYLVIRYKTDEGWARGTKEVVIPYDSITSIQFVVNLTDGFPATIEKNKLFKKTVKKAV